VNSVSILDLDGYWRLPQPVRDAFDKWIGDEDLADKGVIVIQVQGAKVSVKHYFPLEPSGGVSREFAKLDAVGQPIAEWSTITVKHLPPDDIFEVR
jgi:hypothetical protein